MSIATIAGVAPAAGAEFAAAALGAGAAADGGGAVVAELGLAALVQAALIRPTIAIAPIARRRSPGVWSSIRD